jgi:hypothetical protein
MVPENTAATPTNLVRIARVIRSRNVGNAMGPVLNRPSHQSSKIDILALSLPKPPYHEKL